MKWIGWLLPMPCAFVSYLPYLKKLDLKKFGLILAIFGSGLGFGFGSGAAMAEPFRFATWNIENFWHVAGESLRGPYRGRDTIRLAGDYRAIRATIDRLDAHVWALQEMGSPAAAQFLFPADQWHLVFSPRFDAQAGPKAQENRDIYTALAISKDAASLISTHAIALDVSPGNRMGTAALLDIQGARLWVASVHLKSGCRSDLPKTSDRQACGVMAAQLPILETWIDDRLDQGVLVGGDFNRTLVGYNSFQPGDDPAWADLADRDPGPILSFPFTPQVNCPEGQFGARTWPVDFVLASSALAQSAHAGPYVQSMGGRALSDHCPVLVAFDL